ncbi:MAG: phosphoheptose isomerase [Gemmatimonadetes bacterium]|nr:phosphoheptose isomerase [Gemmatimonadota bacterium]
MRPGNASVAVEEPSPAAPEDPLRAVGRARFERSCSVPAAFFEERSDDVSRACWEMARRFSRGGRLLAFGAGPAGASDADHVAVEFVHPVIVGKRALPALALEDDLAERVRLLGSADDVAMAIDSRGDSPDVQAALAVAADRGLLTVALAGPGLADPSRWDHAFVVAEEDPWVVQETLETLYHVLWELVHVFFDHEGLL